MRWTPKLVNLEAFPTKLPVQQIASDCSSTESKQALIAAEINCFSFHGNREKGWLGYSRGSGSIGVYCAGVRNGADLLVHGLSITVKFGPETANHTRASRV